MFPPVINAVLLPALVATALLAFVAWVASTPRVPQAFPAIRILLPNGQSPIYKYTCMLLRGYLQRLTLMCHVASVLVLV